jgi:purine-binding chemotaxis protein CheW
VTPADLDPRAPVRVQTQSYLMFQLGSEDYAIEIRHVLEIKAYTAITPIPNAPAHLKGVMNLRGSIIPVVDLRERFGMPAGNYDKFTVILVVSVQEKTSGVLVDAVTDIVELPTSQVDPPPDLGVHVDTSFLRGMVKVGGRVVLVLDLEQTIQEVMSYSEALSGQLGSAASRDATPAEREAKP